MTQYIKIPVTEFGEILTSLEDLIFKMPTSRADMSTMKEQIELRCNAARAIGTLQAYYIARKIALEVTNAN